ncbi:hypothetical protein Avbf_17884 [Armadillidium vulgare]|nr:hypothetical protein Avbf_17884 [Armadillidium vulgare]
MYKRYSQKMLSQANASILLIRNIQAERDKREIVNKQNDTSTNYKYKNKIFKENRYQHNIHISDFFQTIVYTK